MHDTEDVHEGTDRCVDCGAEEPVDEMHEHPSRPRDGLVCWRCEDNYYLCDWCRSVWHVDEMEDYPTAGVTLCPDCYIDARVCEECENVVMSVLDAYYSDRRDQWLCEYCYEESEQGFGQPGEDLSVCRICRTMPVHFDELTEEFLCDCRAARQVERENTPSLARTVLAAPLTIVDDYGNEVTTTRRLAVA